MWVKRADNGCFLSPDKTLSNASFLGEKVAALTVYSGPVLFNGWARVTRFNLYDGRYLEINVSPEPQSLLEAAEDLAKLMNSTSFPQCIEVKLGNLNSAIERENRKVNSYVSNV